MNSPYFTNGPMVRTEDGVRAARQVLELARTQQVGCAVCGGLLMHLYGFTRATKDIDFIAERPLHLDAVKPLSFGGMSYRIVVDGTDVEVDWIIRNDDLAGIYQLALADCWILDGHLPAVRPEWMVILKHLAGRGKDHMDAVWLLRQDGLVDRSLLATNIRSAMGPHAFWALKDMDSLFLEADLMRARDERGDK